MTWEARFQRWSITSKRGGNRTEDLLREARKAIASATLEDWRWLEEALNDPQRKWFIAAIYRAVLPPARLFEPMLKAAVLERNPSANRYLIEPCTKAFGEIRVMERLLAYLRTGSDSEKAGAASACYWARDENHREDASIVRSQFREAMLKEFIRNLDLDVRRRILPMLDLSPGGFPSEFAAEVAEAIAIARAHPDDYLRHRVEVQVGNYSGPLKPIPTGEP